MYINKDDMSIELSFNNKKHNKSIVNLQNYKTAKFFMFDFCGIDFLQGPTDEISIVRSSPLPKKMNFEKTNIGDFYEEDFKNVKEISWACDKNFFAEVVLHNNQTNFEDCNVVDIQFSSFRYVDVLKGPRQKIKFARCYNSPRIIDFSDTEDAHIADAKLFDTKVLKVSRKNMNLSNVKGFQFSSLDLSGAEQSYIESCDFAGVTYLKCSKAFTEVFFSINVPRTIDLSECQESRFQSINFKSVKTIILPPEFLYIPENHKWVEQVKLENDKLIIRHADLSFGKMVKNSYKVVKDILCGSRINKTRE